MGRAPKLEVTRIEKSVWDMARERVATAFDRSDTIVVMFSGGKDSTVVLNLALEEARRRNRLPLEVCTFDEEAIAYETEDYYRRTWHLEDVNMRWLCVPIVHRNSCSSDDTIWHPWAPEKEDLWVRPLPKEAETEPENFPIFPASERITIPQSNAVMYPPRKYGTVGILMGIRADESLIRRQAVTRKEVDNYIIAADIPGQFKYYPIYDWTTADVWRAPAQQGWDYNHAYNMMEMAGISHHSQRVAPPYGEQPMKSLWMFASCFPDVWDRMAHRVPGAATAARYAMSPLYGIGAGSVSADDLKEGESWAEKIVEALDKFPPGEKEWVTQRIMQFIERHHKATTDPITMDPHPVTGISWKMLYRIALKGDFKNRILPKYITPNTPENQRQAVMRKYRQSLEGTEDVDQ